MVDQYLKCSRCNLDKKITEFNIDKSRCRGRSYWCQICQRHRCRIYYKKNSQFYVKRHLKRTYNLDYETFLSMAKAQNNKCAICKQSCKLVVDHNHSNGSIRKLLCQNCNLGLGIFKENVDLLNEATLYLRQYMQ